MLLFFVIVVVLLAIAGGLFWRWRQRIQAEITEGAAIEWAHLQKHEPEFVAHLDEAAFNAIYDRVNAPRFPGYALAAFATFFLSLPLIFMALAGILIGAEIAGLVPAPHETAERLFIQDGRLIFFRETPPEAALYYIRDLAGFYYFFGVLLSWLAIVAFYMRRYHARRPGYLRDEIIRTKS